MVFWVCLCCVRVGNGTFILDIMYRDRWRLTLERLSSPMRGECGEAVSEEVLESYVLVTPYGSCCVEIIKHYETSLRVIHACMWPYYVRTM